MIQGGLGDVGLLGDVLQAHAQVAGLGEHQRRGAHDLRLAPVAAPGHPGRALFLGCRAHVSSWRYGSPSNLNQQTLNHGNPPGSQGRPIEQKSNSVDQYSTQRLNFRPLRHSVLVTQRGAPRAECLRGVEMSPNEYESTSRTVSVQVDPDLVRRNVERGWWRDRTLIDDLLDHAATHPDKPAVIAHRAGGGRGVPQLGRVPRQGRPVRRGAAGSRVGPGDVVSFQLPNWWQINALHLAAGRIGAVTNAILPILRRREVSFIVERLASKVFITAQSYRASITPNWPPRWSPRWPPWSASSPSTPIRPPCRPGGSRTSRRTSTTRPMPRRIRPRPWTRCARTPTRWRRSSSPPGPPGEPKGVVHTWNTVYAGFMPSVVALGLTGGGCADRVLADVAHHRLLRRGLDAGLPGTDGGDPGRVGPQGRPGAVRRVRRDLDHGRRPRSCSTCARPRSTAACARGRCAESVRPGHRSRRR